MNRDYSIALGTLLKSQDEEDQIRAAIDGMIDPLVAALKSALRQRTDETAMRVEMDGRILTIEFEMP